MGHIFIELLFKENNTTIVESEILIQNSMLVSFDIKLGMARLAVRKWRL